MLKSFLVNRFFEIKWLAHYIITNFYEIQNNFDSRSTLSIYVLTL